MKSTIRVTYLSGLLIAASAFFVSCVSNDSNNRSGVEYEELDTYGELEEGSTAHNQFLNGPAPWPSVDEDIRAVKPDKRSEQKQFKRASKSVK